ncbi:MAG TPA: 2,5-diamino-6-(ribosylamino)-4(3H)-pyrimidinone 5'-phosphate reductase [Methanotrichaceae archaeon]|nr:2,5-diamino-6-(ribosylamino)-4(3H)-pyrimidinone 5'-phosphate reductase [Methanotrichaceae archaeon]
MKQKRPFTFINSAMSADGKISSFQRRQIRISGPEDLTRVAQLRASSDAIMVGVGTVLADDPGLKVKPEALQRSRLERGMPENPIRVVADSQGRTPPDARVLGDECILAVSESAMPERLEGLAGKCQIVVCGRTRVDLQELMSVLYDAGVRRLMLEGGATLNWSMIQAGLVDEIYTYIGAMVIGGCDAPTLVDGAGFSEDFPRLELASLERLDDGALLKWRLHGDRLY